MTSCANNRTNWSQIFAYIFPDCVALEVAWLQNYLKSMCENCADHADRFFLLKVCEHSCLQKHVRIRVCVCLAGNDYNLSPWWIDKSGL